MMGGVRRASVKAIRTCKLQALSRRNLNSLISEYPDVGEELGQVAKARAKNTHVVKESSASANFIDVTNVKNEQMQPPKESPDFTNECQDLFCISSTIDNLLSDRLDNAITFLENTIDIQLRKSQDAKHVHHNTYVGSK